MRYRRQEGGEAETASEKRKSHRTCDSHRFGLPDIVMGCTGPIRMNEPRTDSTKEVTTSPQICNVSSMGVCRWEQKEWREKGAVTPDSHPVARKTPSFRNAPATNETLRKKKNVDTLIAPPPKAHHERKAAHNGSQKNQREVSIAQPPQPTLSQESVSS
jgi:hypothetical protein